GYGASPSPPKLEHRKAAPGQARIEADEIAPRIERVPEPDVDDRDHEQGEHEQHRPDRRDAPAERAHRVREERLDYAPAVEAGTRDQIEEQPGGFQERQERERRIERRRGRGLL